MHSVTVFQLLVALQPWIPEKISKIYHKSKDLLLHNSFITCNFRMYLSEEGDDGVVKGLASGHRVVVRYVVEW